MTTLQFWNGVWDKVRQCSLWVVILTSLGMADVAYAQSPGARQLSERAAIDQALAQNPTERAAVLEERRAEQLVRGEESRYGFTLTLNGSLNIGQTPTLTFGRVLTPYNEQVALSAQLSRTFGFGTVLSLQTQVARQLRRTIIIPTSEMLIELGPGYSIDTTLTLTQPILRGFGEGPGLAQLRNARVQQDAQHNARLRTASLLVRDVMLAYWELWYAQRAYQIQLASREVATRQLADAQARVELGALAELDRLTFETRSLSLDEAVVAGAGQVRMRERELMRLLGAENSGATAATEEPSLDLDDLDLDETVPEPVSTTLERALLESPELAQLRAQVALAQEQTSVAGEAQRPRLDAQASLGVHGLGYDDVGNALTQFGQFGAVTGQVSLIGELELDDTRRRSEESRARLAVEVANENLRAAEDQVRAQVMMRIDEATTASVRADLAERTASVAERSAAAEQERFELGVRTATSVLEAEDQLRSAQLRRVRAQVDVHLAQIQLFHLTGDLLRALE